MAGDTARQLTRHDAIRWGWHAVRAVAAHPSLWGVAVRQLFVLAARGWWRRPPYLPLPDAAYLRFRLQTAYGGSGLDREPRPADLVTYLRWCRGFGVATRSGATNVRR